MNVITRKQAIAQNKKKYFTGVPCKNNHVSERYVISWRCCACISARDKKLYKNCKETRIKQVRKWQSKHPTKVLQYNEKHKKKPDYKLRHQKANQKWKKANRAYCNADWYKRYAHKLRATPIWADFSKIKRIYEKAVRLTIKTGIPHQVDHIIPLLGKTVCGLHVQNNLRVITAQENRTKHNKIIEYLVS